MTEQWPTISRDRQNPGIQFLAMGNSSLPLPTAGQGDEAELLPTLHQREILLIPSTNHSM